MTKKGFTLIELLAVILILGIIALITIPTVNNIINEAKRGSFKSTVQNIAKAVEEQCQVERLRGDELTTTYTFSSEGVLPSLGIKGKLPTGGTITVDNDCSATINNVTDKKYMASKQVSSDNIVITNYKFRACQVTSGDGTNIGDVVTCGTESFYVYDTTGDSIKMLSKYNLKIGGMYNSTTHIYTPYLESEITNMQDENMKGYVQGIAIIYGTTIFAPAAKRENDYSAYEGSIVEEYVNRYKDILVNMGVTVEEARLIKKEEIEQLVNNGDSLSMENIKDRADGLNRPWVCSTTYWTGSAYNDTRVWSVYGYGSFSDNYFYDYYVGVRPVIIIPKSEI